MCILHKFFPSCLPHFGEFLTGCSSLHLFGLWPSTWLIFFFLAFVLLSFIRDFFLVHIPPGLFGIWELASQGFLQGFCRLTLHDSLAGYGQPFPVFFCLWLP